MCRCLSYRVLAQPPTGCWSSALVEWQIQSCSNPLVPGRCRACGNALTFDFLQFRKLTFYGESHWGIDAMMCSGFTGEVHPPATLWLVLLNGTTYSTATKTTDFRPIPGERPITSQETLEPVNLSTLNGYKIDADWLRVWIRFLVFNSLAFVKLK